MSDDSAQFSGTMEVRERLKFDVASLEAYLKQNVDGFKGPLEVAQFKGGQSNPSYMLTTPNRKYVLRRKPPGKLLPSAHAVDREYRVMTALANTEVPVPETFCLCEDEDIIGTMFYVMEFLDGDIEWDPSLPNYSKAMRRPLSMVTTGWTTPSLTRIRIVSWVSLIGSWLLSGIRLPIFLIIV